MTYSYKRSITIDHTKCGASDSTNFPMLFSTTDATFKTVGNGGHVQNTSGSPAVPDDFAFYSDSGLTTLLSWEIEKYVAATGEVLAWVKIPTLTHSSDKVIYLAYGDAAVNTFQGGAAGAAWNSNFKAVYHCGNGSTVGLNDSTSNAVTLTNNGLTAATGQIYGGDQGNGSSQYAEGGSSTTGYPNSMRCWCKLTGTVTADEVILSVVDPTSLNEFWFGYFSSGTLRTVAQNGANLRWLNGVLTADTNWHLIRGEFINSTTQAVYIDGVGIGTSYTGAGATPTGITATILNHVRYNTSSHYGYAAAIIDEARFSNVNEGQDWATAEFNSESSPGTFYTLGAETATSETGTATMAFAGISFSATGTDKHTGTGVMAFTKASFNGAGLTGVFGTGNMAFTKASFAGIGNDHSGHAIMSFAGITLTANGLKPGAPGTGLRQFWTF